MYEQTGYGVRGGGEINRTVITSIRIDTFIGVMSPSGCGTA